jgi:hypothetical protein
MSDLLEFYVVTDSKSQLIPVFLKTVKSHVRVIFRNLFVSFGAVNLKRKGNEIFGMVIVLVFKCVI